MPRIAVCNICLTMERMPDVHPKVPLVPARLEWKSGETMTMRDDDGLPKMVPQFDPVLEDFVERHGHGRDDREAIAGAIQIYATDQKTWDSIDVVQKVKGELQAQTGQWYEERDLYREDAISCYNSHGNPTADEGCPDYMNGVEEDPGVANAPLPMRHQSAATLPVMALETMTFETQDAEGNTISQQLPILASSAESMRQCDTCALALQCPGHQSGAACSYNIPVVIRTKDQRQAVLRTLVEIQAQRILMGSFAEQVTGEANDQVGKEMDRLFTMVEKWKTIEEQTTKLSIGVTASGPDSDGSLGMISRLFGSQAGSNARILDVPVLSDEYVEDAVVVENASN